MNFNFPYTPDNTNYAGVMASLTYPTLTFSEPTDIITYPEIPVTANVGLQKGTQIEPLIFPVPSSGKVYVQNVECDEIRLVNLQGKVLVKTQNSYVDLSGISKGFYLLQIETPKGTLVRKVEKN
jgi:hypothetical protein